MVTIKEIAKMAGVSHGTVSNVLNGRGNVSMKKILLVEEAARKLGYSIDERSKQLRQEFERSIAVVLPNLKDERYSIIYMAALQFLQGENYSCTLYLTNDIPAQEESILNEIAGRRMQGVILVTCQPESSVARDLLRKNNVSIVTIERTASDVIGYVGFDIDEIKSQIIDSLTRYGCHNISIITGLLNHSCESGLLTKLESELPALNIYYHSYQTDSANASVPAFAITGESSPQDAVITTSVSFAQKVIDAYSFCRKPLPKYIITLSPIRNISNSDSIISIELNWKRAAKLACSMVLGKTETSCQVLKPTEKPNFIPSNVSNSSKTEINVIMLEGPETSALMKLLPDFTASTGISARFVVYPYDELHETIRTSENTGYFDVIRMDIAWLEFLYKEHMTAFDCNDSRAVSILAPMLDAVQKPFSTIDGNIYAFPFTPNTQLLFYRRDLFEDNKIRRSYYELNKSNLSVPRNYTEYCHLLHFFSRMENSSSPVEYGGSIVDGGNVSIVCEFLPIFNSLGGQLFNAQGLPNIDTPEGLESLKTYLEIHRNSNKISTNGWWNASVKAFTRGNTAMMNMFINHVSGITDLRKSRIAGRIGFSAIPGSKPLLGGGVLGVAKHSSKKEAALEFIRWACSDHISVPFTLLGGISPCKSVYQSEELIELYPWLTIAPENYLNAVARHTPKGIEEYQVENIIGRAIKNAIYGIFSPEEALHYAQENLKNTILGCS